MAQAFLVELNRLVFLGSLIDQLPIEFGKIRVAYFVSYLCLYHRYRLN